MKTLLDSEAMVQVAEEYGGGRADELLAAIGYGKLRRAPVLSKLVPQEQLQERPPEGTGRRGRAPRARQRRGPHQGQRHRRPDGVPGQVLQPDPRREDRRLHQPRQGRLRPLRALHQRRQPACTTPSGGSTSSGTAPVDASRYTVRLTMQVEDRKGILADVSSKVSDINTNITSVEATTDDDHRGRIDMTVEINDLKHLEKVMKSLRSIAGVLDVERAVR